MTARSPVRWQRSPAHDSAGSSRTSRRADSAREVRAPPEREVEQVPGVPLRPREDALDLRSVEQIRLAAERVELEARALAQLVEEPLVDRNAETLLRPVDD